MFRRLQQSNISPLPIVLLIQLMLIYWVYQPFFSNGETMAFYPSIDGLKNYFTYFTYLTQSENIAADFHTAMNYPFGEYIFYIDNTPALALPLKWFSDHFFDITPYAFRIFNWICLLGILLSTLFSWLILKRLTKHIWLFSIFAITLPWITPQIFRLGLGHFNLSFSWAFLVVFYALIQLYDHRKNWKKVLKISLIISLLVYFISFLHLYYLPMLCVIIGMFGVVIAIWERKNKPQLFKWLAFTFGVPLFNLMAVWLTIRLNDRFYPLRKKVEEAYNWSEWNFKIDGFYTAYDSFNIPFLFKSNLSLTYDSCSYLGAGTLYGLTFLFVWLLIKTIQKRSQFITAFKTYFSGEKGEIALLIFFAGLMCFNLAIGEYAKMFNDKLSLDNPLHPFKYIRLIAGEVTQFRVVARFNWVCFWAFNFTIIYLMDQFFDRHKQSWIRGLLIVFVLFSIVDMVNMQQDIQTKNYKNPLRNQAVIQPIENLLKGIDTKKYQAVLPLPYYLLGSENKEMMLAPNDDWEAETLVFFIKSDLPLMSSHFTRSAIVQHEALLSIFTEKGANDYLKKHLGNRPILIFKTNKKTAWTMEFENEQLTNYFNHGQKIVEQYDMKLLKTEGDYQLFEWTMN